MNWMGWIMKGPVCHAKKLGVYPQSHKELLKGVLSRGSDLCVRRIALAGLWRVDGRGQSWRQGDQSGFLGIFSVVLQILRGGLGWAWHPHAQKDNKSSGGLSEMASRLSLIPPSFAQPSTPTQFQPKGHYSQVPALPRVLKNLAALSVSSERVMLVWAPLDLHPWNARAQTLSFLSHPASCPQHTEQPLRGCVGLAGVPGPC